MQAAVAAAGGRRRAAHLRRLRRHRLGAEDRRARKGPHPLAPFETIVDINLIGTFNAWRLAATAMIANEPDEGGERGVLIDRVGGRLRRPGRPGRLLGVQGRHRRHDPAGRPRPRAATASASTRSPRACSTRRCWPRCPSRRASRWASRSRSRRGSATGRVRAARAVDHREPDAQRRRRSGSTARSAWRRADPPVRRGRPTPPGRRPERREIYHRSVPVRLSPTSRRSPSASTPATAPGCTSCGTR